MLYKLNENSKPIGFLAQIYVMFTLSKLLYSTILNILHVRVPFNFVNMFTVAAMKDQGVSLSGRSYSYCLMTLYLHND